jgi:hypothetical protein
VEDVSSQPRRPTGVDRLPYGADGHHEGFCKSDTGKRLSEALSSASDVHLLTDGKSIYLEEAHNRIIDLLKNARQPMFLVCITDQAKRLSAAANRKPARSESAAAACKARAV